MKSTLRIALPVLILLLFTGCYLDRPTRQRPPTSTPTQPSENPAEPSPKPVQKTAVPTQLVATPGPEQNSSRLTAATTIPKVITVDPEYKNIPVVLSKMFLIALEDGGRSGSVVGCGDSLVAVEIEAHNARTALESLLDHHDRLYGQSGLYSALYQSRLKVNRFEKKGGKVEVDLTGTLTLGGTCDSPRVKEQLMATIRQSADAKIPVTIRVNGDLLDDVLSGK